MSVRMWVAALTIGAIALAGLAVFSFLYVAGAGSPTDLSSNTYHVDGDPASPNKLLSIKINGVIIGDSDDFGGLSSQEAAVSGYQIKDALYQAATDDSIQGIILDINSPGGTIYGAHAIADGVAYYRKTANRPVVAYVQGMATSGAYWAAASTDKIIADYGSDVGSIGVIMGPFTYYDKVIEDGSVVTQNGIQSINITAGTSKDVGNPYRKLSADEVTALQRSVNDDYDIFVSYISQRRHIPAETIRGTIGAMAYGNKAAQESKLIDSSGGRQEAYAALSGAAKLEDDDYEVIRADLDSMVPQPTSLIASALNRAPKRVAETKPTCSLGRVNLALYGDVTALCK
jgi:protease-4